MELLRLVVEVPVILSAVKILTATAQVVITTTTFRAMDINERKSLQCN